MGIVSSTTDPYQACIDLCNRCAQACLECHKACLNDANMMAKKMCLGMLPDCALVCRTAAALMASDSGYARKFCALCAEICEACSKDCGVFQEEHCRKCADECKKCAEECKAVASG